MVWTRRGNTDGRGPSWIRMAAIAIPASLLDQFLGTSCGIAKTVCPRGRGRMAAGPGGCMGSCDGGAEGGLDHGHCPRYQAPPPRRRSWTMRELRATIEPELADDRTSARQRRAGAARQRRAGAPGHRQRNLVAAWATLAAVTAAVASASLL